MDSEPNDDDNVPEGSARPVERLISFPGCDKAVNPLGVGTWAWGDRSVWGMGGYDQALSESTIAEAWAASLDAGVTLFDTAEVYGGGESERIIGRLLATTPGGRDRLLIATKFFPSPLKVNVNSAIRAAVHGSLERLGIESIDLYQLHGPISLRSHSALAEALAAVHHEGLIRAVGVSNYSIREMTSIHRRLAERGVPLASNQIEFSPLRRSPESGGLIKACVELGVVPLAYSPLGQGRLTGKYSAANPPPGRRDFSAFPMESVDPIVEVLRSIGVAAGGGEGSAGGGEGGVGGGEGSASGASRSPAQVALRWIIEKGAVPIPGAKNATQATQNAGALGWSLSPSDIARIDGVAKVGRFSLKNKVWQHG